MTGGRFGVCCESALSDIVSSVGPVIGKATIIFAIDSLGVRARPSEGRKK
jgi:hypothetical protein